MENSVFVQENSSYSAHPSSVLRNQKYKKPRNRQEIAWQLFRSNSVIERRSSGSRTQIRSEPYGSVEMTPQKNSTSRPYTSTRISIILSK